jgi:hypothetical protein
LAAIALWDALGIALGFWIFVRYHLADRVQSAKPGRRPLRTGRRSRLPGFSFDSSWFARIPIETRAVASKELRYLFRSVNGRFVLLAVPILVIVIGAVIPDAVDGPVFGIDPERFLLFGMLLYSVFFSTNFLNNAYMWEADGIRIYFISPVALERVILGKNLGVWLFNTVVVGMALACWLVLMGVPSFGALVSGLLLFAIALVVFTTSGNLMSVLFPIGRDASSILNSPSQTAIFVSIVALMVGASFGGIGLAAAILLGVAHLLPLFLLVILAAVIGIYSYGLKLAARLLNDRKDRVMQALRANS